MTAAAELVPPIRAPARTRWPGGLARKSIATAVGIVAAAPVWDRVRATIRLVASHASALHSANVIAMTMPVR